MNGVFSDSGTDEPAVLCQRARKRQRSKKTEVRVLLVSEAVDPLAPEYEKCLMHRVQRFPKFQTACILGIAVLGWLVTITAPDDEFVHFLHARAKSKMFRRPSDIDSIEFVDYFIRTAKFLDQPMPYEVGSIGQARGEVALFFYRVQD